VKQYRTVESTATAAMVFKMPTISLADGQDRTIGIERKSQPLLGHWGRAYAYGRRRETKAGDTSFPGRNSSIAQTCFPS
jgi:hypothetical protein